MTDKPNPVLPFAPRAHELEKLIRELAQDSRNVRWRSNMYQTHAEERSLGRDITDVMIFQVLRTGYMKGEVELGRSPGEYKVKMCKQMKGRREVGVVTIVINRRSLFVKTVEWEDLK